MRRLMRFFRISSKSLIRGLTSTVDLHGVTYRQRTKVNITTQEALQRDWQVIGDDIKHVMDGVSERPDIKLPKQQPLEFKKEAAACFDG